MIKNDDKLKLKSDGLKLISNTPIYNDERYGSYAEIIDEKVKEAGVYNIGIIAPYGAGKSSLMQWFKEIDENNSAFEMEEGGSLKKKKEDISGSKVLRILSENGFCKVEEMVRYIKIKRIK